MADGLRRGDFTAAAESATRLGSEAKAFQFQLARAFAKRSAAGLPQRLDKAAETYDEVFAGLRNTLA